MQQRRTRQRYRRILGIAAAMAFAAAVVMPRSAAADDGQLPVNLEVFTPKNGNLAGAGSRAFMVDLKAEFNGDVASTGASPELTGPGVHPNASPLPGSFGIGANDDHVPGLVVLLSSSRAGVGPGQNVANDFTIATTTDRRKDRTEVWSTWMVGAPNVFGTPGQNTPSRLFVAIVRGCAPDTVVDMDENGIFDEKDLELMGFDVISNVVKRDFMINGI
ncbi:MAG TPA: hypothetical protein VKE51_21305 [Vicinamibacterales bacterium]|nr:hypothetical protein [Vicinamibacterales bacterium]